jgi:hypothetical protein
MKNIVAVSAGISGPLAAALVSRHHPVELFEEERRLGGHANRVLVDGPNGTVPLDIRFLMHNNDRTCSNLPRLGNFLESLHFDEGFALRYVFPTASAPAGPSTVIRCTQRRDVLDRTSSALRCALQSHSLGSSVHRHGGASTSVDRDDATDRLARIDR